MVSVPVPPAAGSDGELFVTFVVHLDADGPVTLVVEQLPQLFGKGTSVPAASTGGPWQCAIRLEYPHGRRHVR